MDPNAKWYHGSPYKLKVLRAGSTITQWYELARVFSHKPTVVSVSDSREIRHNGMLPGFLYEIAEPVTDADVMPHPRTTMAPGDEWLTCRDLRLALIGETVVCSDELLSEEDIAALRRRAQRMAHDHSFRP